jgi:hypothetical protein
VGKQLLGFVGITVSFLLVLIPADDPYWKAWVLRGAIFFGVSSFGLLAWPTLIRVIRHLSGKPSTLDVTASYDMPIDKAIDYIVNDSTQKLKQPCPPRIADFGPAKGHLLIEKGAEHSDAFRLVAEKAISGDIRILGRRERLPINANPNPNFECLMREIDKGYWRNSSLVFLSCFHETVNIPQTAVSDIADPRYTGLMLDSWQVRRLWKPKATLRNFFERKILRRPRLSYWSPPETLSTR